MYSKGGRMCVESPLEYFARRSAEELSAAEAARPGPTASTHLVLAGQYTQLAEMYHPAAVGPELFSRGGAEASE